MQHGTIPHIACPVSRIVAGLGGFCYSNEARCLHLIDRAMEQGINCFDTAHLYFHGDAQRILGQWLRATGARDNVVLITKGAHSYLGAPRLDPHSIRNDLDDSLHRLGVDHVDLFLLHRDEPARPVDEIVDVLDDLRRCGLVGAVGVANWNSARIVAANTYARKNNKSLVVACSNQYGLLPARELPDECVSLAGPEHRRELDLLSQHSISLFAWGCLGGLLDVPRGGAAWRALTGVAREFGATPMQVAIAYVLAQQLDVYAIVGTLDVQHVIENAGAASLAIPEPVLRNLAKDL